MKKLISDFVLSQGGSAEYSGKTNTLFINGTGIEKQVLLKFGWNIPFKLKTNN